MIGGATGLPERNSTGPGRPGKPEIASLSVNAIDSTPDRHVS
jgi:hypothetical protein